MKKYEWGNRENTTLVFLHGMGSTGLSFGELAQYLANKHVVSIDLVDAPLYDINEGDYLPARMAEKVGQFLKKLGKQDVFLVGHSWGAHLALYAAKAYPEQIRGVILLDGGYIQSNEMDTLKEELVHLEEFHNSVRFSSWEAFIESEKSELPRWSAELERASRSQVIEIDGEIRLALPVTAAKAIVKGTYAEPTCAILSQVTCPVLLLRSTLPEEMENFRKQQSDYFQKSVPDAKIRVMRNTSHDIYRDAPGEVALNIEDWISKQAD